MSFDIRRATKDQLDKINAEIKAGKSGKNYTIHQSGGLDFILTENTGVIQEQIEISKGIEDEEANWSILPKMEERSSDIEMPLEFNFGP